MCPAKHLGTRLVCAEPNPALACGWKVGLGHAGAPGPSSAAVLHGGVLVKCINDKTHRLSSAPSLDPLTQAMNKVKELANKVTCGHATGNRNH